MVKSIWLIYAAAYCRELVWCRTGKIVLWEREVQSGRGLA